MVIIAAATDQEQRRIGKPDHVGGHAENRLMRAGNDHIRADFRRCIGHVGQMNVTAIGQEPFAVARQQARIFVGFDRCRAEGNGWRVGDLECLQAGLHARCRQRRPGGQPVGTGQYGFALFAGGQCRI